MADRQLTSLELAEAQLTRMRTTDAAVCAWETLDPEHVRREAGALGRDAASRARSAASASGSRTSSTPPTCRRRSARRFSPTAGRRTMRRASRACGPRGRSCSARPSPRRSRSWIPARRAIRGTPRTRPADRRRGPQRPSPSGHVTAAIGTQTNGSVIRPAAFCGVVGFKPTLRRDSDRRRASVQRDVRHRRHVHAHGGGCGAAGKRAGRSGPHRRNADAAGAAAALRLSRRFSLDGAGLRRRRRRRSGGHAAADARGSGAARHPRRLARGQRRSMRTIMLFEAARNSGRPAVARARAAFARRQRRRWTKAGRSAHAALRRRAWRSASGPSRSSRAGSKASTRCWRRPHRVRRRAGLATTGDPSCCTLWSLLGFPALTLPVGLAQRMPVGLQLAAPAGCDDSLLAVAAWCGARLSFRRSRVADCAGPALITGPCIGDHPTHEARQTAHRSQRRPSRATRSPARRCSARAARTARPTRRCAARRTSNSRSSSVPRIPASDPMTLCRSDLESGRMRALYIEASGNRSGCTATSSCPTR